MNTEFKKLPKILRVYRVIWMVLNLMACMVCAMWILWTERDYFKRTRKFAKNANFWCGRGIRILNFKINLINFPKEKDNYLVLCNHMGFMDILSMASIMEGVFVTSQEMKETPVLGKICEMGGCIFIERRSREQIPNEIRVLGNHLKENLNIILFPEGTSGDGSRILPIKKSFVLAGQGTGKNILPVVINYKKINGKIPMSHQFRDYLCWYGDMGFGSTFWKMTEIESVDVDLVFADPIIVTEESDRKVAAAHVQNFFEDKFEPVTYPEGVPQFDLAEYLARQKAKATALKVSKAEKQL